MPSLRTVLLCSVVELLLGTCVGYPFARVLAKRHSIALALAPIIGWAVFATLALLILSSVGWSRTTAALLCAASVFGGLAVSWSWRGASAGDRGEADVPVWAWAAAGLLALVPALAVVPKVDGGILLAEPVFDHAKIAIIDDIARLGLPPGNPFFGGTDIAPVLPYYYLWHFSGAVLGVLLGATGWEADIALTWFTAFASLTLLMGLAVAFGGRRTAAPLVLILSFSGSLYPVLRFVFTPASVARVLSQSPWPQGWAFQASWAPQHLAAACCVVLSVFTMARLAESRSWLLVALLGILVAAGFECSVWVGGIIFAVGALLIGFFLLLTANDTEQGLAFLLKGGAALVLALAVSLPLLRAEYAATAARSLGPPIIFRPFEVLSEFAPAKLRYALNLPAYWIVLLGIQLPAIYLTGGAAVAGAVHQTRSPGRRFVIVLALLAGASLAIPWLFASIIANNDLGWRGVLPGVLVLTIFAAAGLAHWLRPVRMAAITAIICWALGLPGGWLIAEENAVGLPSASAALLAETPAMWAAVRRHSAPDERVANNPLFLADAVRWPINISWALLAGRRSCFAGWNLARAFVPLPKPEIDRINALFERVFAGDGTPQDVLDLADRYNCRVIVVTANDGAWSRNPFAGSGRYRLVEEQAGKWRIYRLTDSSRDGR